MPLRERSTEVIKYLRSKLGKAFPIVAVGGIMCAGDALEKLNAGADLIQLYTGFIYEGPRFGKRNQRSYPARRLAEWQARYPPWLIFRQTK